MLPKGNSNKTETFLALKIHKEQFAISVSRVLEVLEMQSITELPGLPAYIPGVISFREQIVPLIDLRLKLGFESNNDKSKAVIAVLEIKQKEKNIWLGAIADNVSDVIKIPYAEVKSIPNVGKQEELYLHGMWKSNDRFYLLLDVDQVFANEDIDLTQISNYL